MGISGLDKAEDTKTYSVKLNYFVKWKKYLFALRKMLTTARKLYYTDEIFCFEILVGG